MTFEPLKLKKTLEIFPKPNGYLVAYSGGIDSHVLLHSIAQIQSQINIPVRAIHLNHCLHEKSDHHEKHCEKICKNLNIPFLSFMLDLAKESQKNLEAVARERRYQVLSRNLKKNEMLLTAHHKDDQVETLLLQLLRGAGVSGLACMPNFRAWHEGWQARPLLEYSKEDLREYGNNYKLHWIEDPSNENQHFDRNYIRHSVLPIIENRWRSYRKTMTRSVSHISNSLNLIQEIGESDLEFCLQDVDCLSVRSLKKLSLNRRCNVLRVWITKNKKIVPNTKRLLEIDNSILNASENSSPILNWNNVSIYRYRDLVWISNTLDRNYPIDKFLWPSQDRILLPSGNYLERRPADFGIPLKIWDQKRIFQQ